MGDVGEARRAAGRTVESSKNEFLACRTVCSFDFCSSLPRGRNDLSRLVENRSVGFGRRESQYGGLGLNGHLTHEKVDLKLKIGRFIRRKRL